MGARPRRIRRGAAGALCLAGLALPIAFPGDAGAQEDRSGFRRGEAEANADTFTLNIVQGSADIGFTYGRSLANYRDRTASAEARALDLGVLPTLLASETCDGTEPPMNPDTLPVKTRVDSTEAGAANSRRTEVFVPGSDGGPHGPAAGTQDAVATEQPLSRSETTSVDTDIFLLALEGGRTSVTTRLDGELRQAHAVSTADELRVFGGLFTFSDVRWQASATSGSEERSEGSFTFSKATVLGVERTPEQALADFAEFEWGLEQLLAPLGVDLSLPEVEVADGRVRVTPMAFRVVDPPFGAQVLAPFLGSIQPQREAEYRRLLEEDCKNDLVITLLDVVLGVLAGSGSIEVLAGGVEVLTADTDFSVEPLMPLPLDLAPALAMPELPSLPPPPPPSAPLPVTTTTAPPEVKGRSEEDDDEEVAQAYVPAMPSSRFEDTDAGAAAVAVGSAGLAGALLLAFGERIVSRRRARRTA